MKGKRPRSIRWFEWTIYFWLGLSVVNTNLTVRALRSAQPDPTLAPSSVVYLFLILSLVISGFLVWLAAYRANNVARWIFVVLAALGLLSLLRMAEIMANGGLVTVIALVDDLMSVAVIWLLFRPDSRDWFAGRRPVDPAVFD